MKARRYIKSFLIILSVFLIGGYVYYEGRSLMEGPTLKITEPVSGFTSGDSLINIAGVATNISSITLNDNQIFVNEKGQFKEKLLLSPGYNVIEVEVVDKFNRQNKEVLEVVYK